MSGQLIADESTFATAVEHWWSTKRNGSGRRGKKGKAKERSKQGGTRDSNLAGKTMDGFRDVIIHELLKAGVSADDIFSGNQFSSSAANLPSYYRVSKNWDVIVCRNSRFRAAGALVPRKFPRLVAAVEFKSQEGSIGNNQNNRIEESIGNATDFWASYENGNFASLVPRPWLGYLFVGKYEGNELEVPVEVNLPHFLPDAGFAPEESADYSLAKKYKGPSYAHRYRIFLQRMIAKRQYDAACLIATSEQMRESTPNYRCLSEELSGSAFVEGLVRHVKAYY